MVVDDNSDDINKNPISGRRGARRIEGFVESVDDGGSISYEVWEWNNTYFVTSWWTEVDADGHEYVDGDRYWREIEASTDDEAVAYVSNSANRQ